jgi:hypothetical protein
MSNTTESTAIRRALLIDATASGATGFLLAAGAAQLEPVLGLPVDLMRGVGIFLIPFAAFLAWLAPRALEARGLLRAIVIGNVLWVLASGLLLESGWVTPTTLGTAFVAAQAVAVAIFAYLEYRAVARAGASVVA